MMGRDKSSSVNPMAFNIARAGARSGPTSKLWLVSFNSFGIIAYFPFFLPFFLPSAFSSFFISMSITVPMNASIRVTLARMIHDSSAAIADPLLRQASSRRARPSDLQCTARVRLRSGLRAPVTRHDLAISPRTVVDHAGWHVCADRVTGRTSLWDWRMCRVATHVWIACHCAPMGIAVSLTGLSVLLHHFLMLGLFLGSLLRG